MQPFYSKIGFPDSVAVVALSSIDRCFFLKILFKLVSKINTLFYYFLKLCVLSILVVSGVGSLSVVRFLLFDTILFMWFCSDSPQCLKNNVLSVNKNQRGLIMDARTLRTLLLGTAVWTEEGFPNWKYTKMSVNHLRPIISFLNNDSLLKKNSILFLSYSSNSANTMMKKK